MIQTKSKAQSEKDSNNIALDYYLSGIKIDPRHYGCVYNTACCYFFERKYRNAYKWFQIAIRLQPQQTDSHFGKTVCCLKLGKNEEALETITQACKQTLSPTYTREQYTLLQAVCNRVCGNFQECS
jgi:tetratricopeptide (TPR) repeat protein